MTLINSRSIETGKLLILSNLNLLKWLPRKIFQWKMYHFLSFRLLMLQESATVLLKKSSQTSVWPWSLLCQRKCLYKQKKKIWKEPHSNKWAVKRWKNRRFAAWLGEPLKIDESQTEVMSVTEKWNDILAGQKTCDRNVEYKANLRTDTK